MTARRTIRRYAHELYPHPGEFEVRELATDVPYLYARACGLEVWGTGWHDLSSATASTDSWRRAANRTMELIKARELAFVADALHQGLVGDEAWAWAQERASDETGELAYERAVHYGVDPTRIKPYPCGSTPDSHDHMASTGDITGQGIITRAPGSEDDCPTCTEPDTSVDPAHPLPGSVPDPDCCKACRQAIARVPRVDPDIIEHVHEMKPSSIGQRIALERTLQDCRDGESR